MVSKANQLGPYTSSAPLPVPVPAFTLFKSGRNAVGVICSRVRATQSRRIDRRSTRHEISVVMVKAFLCRPSGRCGGVEVQRHSCSTSTLNWGEWSDPFSDPPPNGVNSHWIAGWLGTRARVGVGAYQKRHISFPFPDSNLESSVFQFVEWSLTECKLYTWSCCCTRDDGVPGAE